MLCRHFSACLQNICLPWRVGTWLAFFLSFKWILHPSTLINNLPQWYSSWELHYALHHVNQHRPSQKCPQWNSYYCDYWRRLPFLTEGQNMWMDEGCWFTPGGCHWFRLQSKGRLLGTTELTSGEGLIISWQTQNNNIFLNIYEKGYLAKMVAWKNGRQLDLQPDFKKINWSQIISSASVTTDHVGNKREVKLD